MKCMVMEKFEVPLSFREREVPTPGVGEVLIKVGACGVCSTDLKIWQGKHPLVRKLPLIPGHEVSGEIVEVGKGVDAGHIGKHVVVTSYLFCGECNFCRSGRENLCSNLGGIIGLTEDGGYSEYLKVPVKYLFFISEDIPFEEAAIIPDAIATSYHALTSKVKIQQGETLAVIGAGGLGLHAIQIAKVFGARVIAIDIKEKSLALAKEMGSDVALRAKNDNLVEEIMDLSGGKGVDGVIDFVGDPRMENLALNILKVAGRFVAVGYNPEKPFQVNSMLLVSKELEIYGSRACGRDDVKQVIDLVTSSKIKPFIGEIHPLVEANLVLDKLGRGDIVGRSVLIP